MRLTFQQAIECDKIRVRVDEFVELKLSSCDKQIQNQILKFNEDELKGCKLSLEQLFEDTDRKREKVSILHSLLDVERLLSEIIHNNDHGLIRFTDDFGKYCKIGMHLEPNDSKFNYRIESTFFCEF